MDNIKKLHNDARRMNHLKNKAVRLIDKSNSKLSSFLEECILYEDGENIVAVIDNGNQFIKKVLNADKDIILDVITSIADYYKDINFVMFNEHKEYNEVYNWIYEFTEFIKLKGEIK